MKTRLCHTCGREHALFYLQDHLGKRKLMMTCDAQTHLAEGRDGVKTLKRYTGDIQLKMEKGLDIPVKLTARATKEANEKQQLQLVMMK